MKTFVNRIEFGGDASFERVAGCLRLSPHNLRWRLFGRCSRGTRNGGEVSIIKRGGGRYTVTFRGNNELAIKRLMELDKEVWRIVTAADGASGKERG